jgi:hypothetical protein
VPVAESSSSSSAARGRAPDATFAKPIEFVKTSTPAASSSKTRLPDEMEAQVDRRSEPTRANEKMKVPEIKTLFPAPRQSESSRRTRRSLPLVYARLSLGIARRDGAIVEDVDGNVFLDCAAGIAVNSTGVSHPEVVKAIADQAAKFIHMSGTDFYYEPQVRLAEELASLVPIAGDVRTFFANSGTGDDGSGAEAVALLHEAAERHRVSRLVPRPFARRARADVEQVGSAPRASVR